LEKSQKLSTLLLQRVERLLPPVKHSATAADQEAAARLVQGLLPTVAGACLLLPVLRMCCKLLSAACVSAGVLAAALLTSSS
jgi:hypothetical protein